MFKKIQSCWAMEIKRKEQILYRENNNRISLLKLEREPYHLKFQMAIATLIYIQPTRKLPVKLTTEGVCWHQAVSDEAFF